MSKISVSLGLNIPLNEGNRFDRFTPSVGVNDIDTDGNVDEQIKLGIEVADKCWTKISDLIEKKIKEETERSVKIPS